MNNHGLSRILFVPSIYKPNVGGVETSIDETIKALNPQVSSKVLTKRYPVDLSEHEKIDGTSIFRFTRPKSDADFDSLLDWLEEHESELIADIVHVIGVRRPMPLVGLLLAKRWGVPCVMTFSGGDVPNPDDSSSQTVWSEGLSSVPQSILQADALTAYSHYTALQAKKVVLTSNEIQVLLGGVDLPSIVAAPEKGSVKPYFFTARRLEYVKGIDILLRAFANVSSSLLEYELVIAGDGSESNALKNLVSELGLSDRIRFLGTVTRDEVYSYMKGAVAHICPSRAESGGLVNFEAQAAGCLSIGSDAGGIPEYISENKTGLLFKNGDVQDLANCLQKAVNDKEGVELLKKQGTLLSQGHSWVSFADRYRQLYESTISTHTARPFQPWSPLAERLSARLLTQTP